MIITGEIGYHHVEKLLRAGKSEDIVLCSSGGQLGPARALYDLVLNYGYRTIALGECSSAAFLVWLAGRERYCTDNTRFLFHDAYVTNFSGDAHAMGLESTELFDFYGLAEGRLRRLSGNAWTLDGRGSGVWVLPAQLRKVGVLSDPDAAKPRLRLFHRRKEEE